MTKQITVHAITNCKGETVGWAVLRNKAEKMAEFETAEQACTFADAQEKKAMKTYTATIEKADGTTAIVQFLAADGVEVGHVVTGAWHDHNQIKHRETGKVLRIAAA